MAARPSLRDRLLGAPSRSTGVLAMVASAAYPAQRLMLFPAPRPVRRPSVSERELVAIERDGGTIYAVHFEAPAGARTIVHFHGNGEQLSDNVFFGRALRKRGVGVVLAEYPGYGLSSSLVASEPALYDAAEATIAHVKSLGVAASSLVLSGHSLGTGVAVELASRGHGAKLVLTAPFTSIPDMASVLVPLLPSRWLVRDRFDSLAKAPSIERPTLILHGTHDELVPFSMGKKLAEAFPNATLVPIEGAHHNDLVVGFGAELLDAIARFAAA